MYAPLRNNSFSTTLKPSVRLVRISLVITLTLARRGLHLNLYQLSYLR